jgi:3-methyladenine DNA glycosylase AlkD
MEMVMLRGMLPCYAPQATLTERLNALRAFIPSIRNWSICDSCCATYTFAREARAEVQEFLLPYLRSTAEYEARFAVVMLLNHYLNESAYAAQVGELLAHVHCRAYYADMAVAWCACELILRYPPCEAELMAKLPPDRQKLTQRKIRESRRCGSKRK